MEKSNELASATVGDVTCEVKRIEGNTAVFVITQGRDEWVGRLELAANVDLQSVATAIACAGPPKGARNEALDWQQWAERWGNRG